MKYFSTKWVIPIYLVWSKIPFESWSSKSKNSLNTRKKTLYLFLPTGVKVIISYFINIICLLHLPFSFSFLSFALFVLFLFLWLANVRVGETKKSSKPQGQSMTKDENWLCVKSGIALSLILQVLGRFQKSDFLFDKKNQCTHCLFLNLCDHLIEILIDFKT